MKRNCTKKIWEKENRKQGTLQSCLNACQELESWIENGLVLFLVSLLTLLCVLPQVVALAAANTAATSKSRRSSCTARDYFALNIVLSLQWMPRKEHKKRKVVEGGVERGACIALYPAVVMKDYLVGEWTSRVDREGTYWISEICSLSCW